MRKQNRFIFLLLTLALFHTASWAARPVARSQPRKSTQNRSDTVVSDSVERDDKGRRVVYKQKNVVNFDSMLLEGDVKNPNEFYFVHRPEEKFGTLVKKRPHFHKEMLRDAVMTQ